MDQVPDATRLKPISARPNGPETIVIACPSPADLHAANLQLRAQIAEHAQVAEQLRESEAYLKQLIDSLPQMVWTCAADGCCDFLSRQVLEFVGMQAGDLIGDQWTRMIHPEDRARVVALWQKVTTDQVSYDVEFRIRRHDGHYRWFQARALPIHNEAGKIFRWFGTCTDVHDRRLLEQSRADSEDRLRLAADASDLGTYDYNPQTGTMIWSEASKRHFGVRPESHIDYNSFLAAVHPEDRAQAHAAIQKAMNPGSDRHFTTEYRTRGPHDRQERWILVTGRVLLNESQHPCRVIGTTMDITARKQTEFELQRAKKAAEEANRAKDEFLATLSHELRTPLNPILLMVSCLLRDSTLSPEVRDSLGIIQRNTELEARLIDDLLDLTRIVHGKIELRARPVDLHNLIQMTCQICRNELEGKLLKLQMELHAPDPNTIGDGARLQQILWNLLKNAIKFTPNGGTITMRSRQEEGFLAIEIVDTGIGFDPAVIPTLFAPFEQGNAEVTRRFGGLGLGLTISQRLAELHGGSINAHSAGPGRGATFQLRVPIRRSFPPRQPEAAPLGTTGAAHGGQRILLVEDHPDTVRVMRLVLQTMHHHVTVATTVAAALHLAETQPFDVVISDLGLPDGDGREMMRQIRRIQSIPGVALSGFGMQEDVRRSLEAGFSTHLTKPLNIDLLEKTLDHLINERKVENA